MFLASTDHSSFGVAIDANQYAHITLVIEFETLQLKNT